MTTLTEADVEAAALDWLSALGWQVAHGPDIAPDTPNAERGLCYSTDEMREPSWVAVSDLKQVRR